MSVCDLALKHGMARRRYSNPATAEDHIQQCSSDIHVRRKKSVQVKTDARIATKFNLLDQVVSHKPPASNRVMKKPREV